MNLKFLNISIYNRAILIALLYFISVQISYSEYGELKGTVIDLANDAVIGQTLIIIESIDLPVKKYYETSSDMIGKYSFENIEIGKYKLTAKRLGYKTEVIENITIVPGEKQFNILLVPIDIEIDKINVTATKTELTLKQTPSSISVIGSEEIKNRNPLTFDDILNDVQGVTVFKTSGINVQSLSIRGSSDVAGGGIGNRVLLLLDGRPSLTGDSKGALWSLIPISIIERTEVVKGIPKEHYGR